jgi:RNA polymerase sigma-70 factor (sigma-E family)
MAIDHVVTSKRVPASQDRWQLWDSLLGNYMADPPGTRGNRTDCSERFTGDRADRGGQVRDTEGFHEFVAGRQATLVRAGWLLTGDAQLAEDLVQTALLKALPRWRKLHEDGGAEAYVRRVMFTTFVSWRRRKWRDEVPTIELPDQAPTRSPQADWEDRDALLAAVRALPPRQRAVVTLRFYLDLSETESAVTLGCAPGTVKSQTSKALATLRRTLPAGLTEQLSKEA